MVLFVDYLHYLNLVSVRLVCWTGWSAVGSRPVPKLAYIHTPAPRVAMLLGVPIDGVAQTLAGTNVLILHKTRISLNSDSAVLLGFKSLPYKSVFTFLPQESRFSS